MGWQLMTNNKSFWYLYEHTHLKHYYYHETFLLFSPLWLQMTRFFLNVFHIFDHPSNISIAYSMLYCFCCYVTTFFRSPLNLYYHKPLAASSQIISKSITFATSLRPIELLSSMLCAIGFILIHDRLIETSFQYHHHCNLTLLLQLLHHQKF